MSERKTHSNTKILVNQFETFINMIPGSLYWKDKQGVYLGCNDIVLAKGNLASHDKIIGKTDYDIWPEFADDIRRVDLKVMELDQVLETEETVVLKNGECMYFLSVKSPLKDENGKIIGVIGNSLDITELKQAKQLAEAASNAKTQFLALMGHEFRMPLSGIISTANMLVETDITLEESRELGKIIEQSGSYLLSTINNILDFAKLEVNKFELSPATLDLKALIKEICAIFDASAKEKNINLYIDYDPSIPTQIISDSRVLRHILTNLISNAIKYTMKGKITVRLKLMEKSDQFIKLKIAIRDTGIGIPEGKIKYIFDRFYQLENTYTRKNSRGGTGLGLSIVKKLVKLLNSEIKVKSTLNKGSTFYFVAEFPLAKKRSKSKSGKNREKCIVS